MKQKVFFVAMSVVVVMVIIAAGPAAIGAPQEQAMVVTSAADSGPGTLREALERATPGTTITFDPAVFPPDNPATITVISPLPELAQGQVTIDGSNAGVILHGSALGSGEGFRITSHGNVIQGLQILYFPGSGIWIESGASNNLIGGSAPGEGNVISGNWDGVNIVGSDAVYNTVSGNYIGTDVTGTAAMGNLVDGVWIGEGAQYNVIGGATEGDRNIISSNGNTGVVIDGSMYNTVIGNYIGTDATGTRALGNGGTGVGICWGAQYNLIGGATAEERNVISGNEWEGVWIGDPTTSNNTVSGNYIGTDASGTAAIPNGNFGVNLGNSAQYNLIGGATAGERNVISGNVEGGVVIGGTGTMHNTVIGNYIGMDASGTAALGNKRGVNIVNEARHNVIGGTMEGERNIISGNDGNGLVIEGAGTIGNTVIGNYIGTDVSGALALGNAHRGVGIFWGAQENRIGGTAPGERNIISGNGAEGVGIEDIGTDSNIVIGNFIGTDINGLVVLGNGGGVAIFDGAQGNIIGGAAVEERNIISGNDGNGVIIGTRKIDTAAHHNTVSGNYIGVDASGTKPLGNLESGVVVEEGAGLNIIGPGNIIAYNGVNGVQVRGSESLGNTVTTNSIHDNEGLGIENSEGGNTELFPPTITYIGTRFIRGTVPPNATVEIFSDEEDEGRLFEGNTIADEEGNFVFRMLVGRFTGPNVTATATDREGNTSQFSPPESPPAPVVTRELPDIVAPTQVSVEPKVVGTNVGLALFCVLFFGFTSAVFNSILVDYRDELVGGFDRLIPGPLAVALDRVGLSLRGTTEKGRGRLLLMWLIVLLVTSLIESFLDPEVGLLSPERLGILITLFISAVVVSALELGSDLYAHRRLAPTMKAESKIQWIGMAVAVACVTLSRALDFKPGYLYGMVGAIYLMPRLADITNSGKRAVLVLLSIFVGGFILWIATTFLPATLADLEPLFLTIFLISLQGVFFGLFPLALTDGGDIWNWRRGVWFAFFSIVFFCFYHFLLNPNASDVQALQQNGVQTLLILMLVFGLATFTLWLLFPFRLGRKKVSQG